MIIRNKLTLSNSVYSLVDMLIWKHVWCPACECIDASAGRYGVFYVNRILWRGVSDCTDNLSINISNKILQEM